MKIHTCQFIDETLSFPLTNGVQAEIVLKMTVEALAAAGTKSKFIIVSLSSYGSEDAAEAPGDQPFSSFFRTDDGNHNWFMDHLHVYSWTDHPMHVYSSKPEPVNLGGQASSGTSVSINGGIGFFGPMPTMNFSVGKGWNRGGAIALQSYVNTKGDDATTVQHGYDLKVLMDGTPYKVGHPVLHKALLPPLALDDFSPIIDCWSWGTPADVVVNTVVEVAVQFTAYLSRVADGHRFEVQAVKKISVDLGEIHSGSEAV